MYEQRFITFRNSEVIDALRLFRDNKGLDARSFDAFKMVDVNGNSVIECHDQARKERHQYYDEEVCLALLLYCMRHNVPIPRRAEKSVYLKNDDVKLVISLSGYS